VGLSVALHLHHIDEVNMTTELDKLFGTSKDLEAGRGVEIEYPGGVKFLIHRAGGSNKKFQSVFEAKFKPHRRQHEMGVLAENIAEKIMLEAYSEAIVVGWEGVELEKGKPLEFTPENCVKVLSKYPDLFLDLQKQANDISVFKQEEEETDTKN